MAKDFTEQVQIESLIPTRDPGGKERGGEKRPRRKKKKAEKDALYLKLDMELGEKVRAMAYWDRKTLHAWIISAIEGKLEETEEPAIRKAIREYKKSLE